MNMFEYIMHKDSYYALEREVRAVAFRRPVDHFESETVPGFLVFAPVVDLAKLIQGVVLHPEASPAFEVEITELCLLKGLARPERSRCAPPVLLNSTP